MTAGQVAALIAAVFFAVLSCAAIFVLLRLARLMSAVTGWSPITAIAPTC